MNLSDQDKEKIKGMIDRGEPLPPKYRLLLFADTPEVELIWQGKSSEVTNVVLPFQSIEQIDEPRKDVSKQQLGLFSIDAKKGRQSGGWSNKLIWGDNKLVLSSLKNGPLRREIEDEGGLKLVYIDPPFDVGANFSFDVEIGDDSLTKEPSVLEELAYRDTWGRGADSFMTMIHDRVVLIRDLLAESGILFLHVGWNISHAVRSTVDEIFGQHNCINQVIWKRQAAHSDSRQGADHLGRIHDVILIYSKSTNYNWNMQYEPYSKEYLESAYKFIDSESNRQYRIDNTSGPGGASKGNPLYEFKGVKKYWRYSRERLEQLYQEGRLIQTKEGGDWGYKRYLDEMPGVPIQDLWIDIPAIQSQSLEGTGYSTQKPEKLLDRVLTLGSNEGDLVADFFCGSGTTLAVAEKLGRKWIGCDLGRFAIHTARKRLISVQRQLRAEEKPYRSFEILNLGKYERQYFVGVNLNLPEEERKAQSREKEEHYLNLILNAYKAEKLAQYSPFHGKKGGVLVFVGPIDSPVTLSQVNEIIDQCQKKKISKVDILGFEFEMGLAQFVQDEAKQKGVGLSLKFIPKDVFDRRAIERGQVQFYDVAYVEILPKVEKQSITVTLKDFGVFYRQEDLDATAESLKPGGSKVIVEDGQVVKVSKDKKGAVSKDVLTKKWTDWIDYWAVDFHFEDKKEIIRIMEDGEEKEVWTGNYIFENEWQSFRTRKDRNLELTSGKYEYPAKGKYKIAVKVIDIFGNDTTKAVEVKV